MKGGFKLILLGLLLYLIFKNGKNGNKTTSDGKSNMSDEEKYIRELIEELSSKTNQTRKDKDNIDLLLVKLKQILK